jgi:hypothetical protein
MTTTLEQLIEKLQSLVESGVDLKIPVILEHNIDEIGDTDYSAFNAQNFFLPEGQSPITFRLSQAQSNRTVHEKTDDCEEDRMNDDYIEYGYDGWEESDEDLLLDKQDVLVLSSPAFKYGTGEKDSL